MGPEGILVDNFEIARQHQLDYLPNFVHKSVALNSMGIETHNRPKNVNNFN
jgi:hypothetical protein